MLFSSARIHDTMNGILLSLLFALSAMYLGSMSWMAATGLSPLILAIFMGMIYANTLRSKLPAEWVPGVQFTAKNILRLSIILYGFRLTFHEIASLGWQVLALDLAVIASTLGLAWLVGTKLLGMDRDSSLLVGSGSGICGAAAVLATEGTLQSEPYKTASAVATVVIFGTISMLLYPLAQTHGWLGLTDKQFGIWSGATIHEVAQVVAAGNLAGGVSYADAVLVKMGRVLLMAPVLLFIRWLLQYFATHSKSGKATKAPTPPWFILYFIAVVALNSLDLIPKSMVNVINQIDQLLLVAAMAALGIESTWEKITASGPKSFMLASVLFVWLSVGGLMAVKTFF